MKMKLILLLVSVFLLIGQTFAKSKKNVMSQYSIDKVDVMKISDRVIDWQLKNAQHNDWWNKNASNYGYYHIDWEYATFYIGLMEWYKVNNQESYFKAMYKMGNEHKWTIRPRLWDANVLCIGQVYVDMYNIVKEPKVIESIGFCLDAYFDRDPEKPDLRFEGNDYWWSWWSWCDALFMAPSTFVKYSNATQKPKYLNKMDELYKMTYDYLYSKEDSLFFRDDRFFNMKSPNGKKVFWSRGNGWVIAGLANILKDMPKDYKNRVFYESLFVEMCTKIRQIQQPDGYWTSNLVDPKQITSKESSGTSFFCYALAYGVNSGLLDKNKFLPEINKSWSFLTSAVHENGMLGYVQQVGDAPDKVSFDDTQGYGVGGFLLAASEVYKLAK